MENNILYKILKCILSLWKYISSIFLPNNDIEKISEAFNGRVHFKIKDYEKYDYIYLIDVENKLFEKQLYRYELENPDHGMEDFTSKIMLNRNDDPAKWIEERRPIAYYLNPKNRYLYKHSLMCPHKPIYLYIKSIIMGKILDYRVTHSKIESSN